MLIPTRLGRFITGVFLGAWFILSPAFPIGAAAEPRLALVIGNSSYRSFPELTSAQEDAALVSASLKEARFDVLTIVNADTTRLRDSVNRFAAKVKGAQPGAVAFIYYAGHGGADDEQRNYLFPTDMEVQATSAAPEGAYPLDALLTALESPRLSLAFVVLDTDQSNPFRNRGEDPGYADTETPHAAQTVGRRGKVMIAFSASPGPATREPMGKNGPYAEALAEEMLRPGSSADEVFRRVSERVLAASDGLQKPWVAQMPDRMFYFNGKSPAIALRDKNVLPAQAGLSATGVAYGGAISGARGTDLQTGLSVARPMKIERDTDYPAGDYRDIKEITEEGCSTTCGTDSRCVAFSYVPGQRLCWLKNRVGPPNNAVGIVSGLKR
jgi:uncharacterized caspase-like protein